MISIYVFLLFFLVTASLRNCNCLEYEHQEAYFYGGRQNIFEYPPNTNIQEDIKQIKEIFPDSTEERYHQQPEDSRFLQDTVNAEYAAVISNLAQENEPSFNVKIAAIRRALESAFKSTTTGVIDTPYVVSIINMIKNDVDQHRRRNYGPYRMPFN